MKPITLILSFIAVIGLLACKKKPSLQSYFVESQEKKGFIAVDIPSSILKVSQGEEISATLKENIESIKKVNIVALPYKNHETEYNVEKEKLQTIFKNTSTYKNLLTIKDKRGNINVYYTGDATAINEIIAFGFNENIGVGVARILGDNMNPNKIIQAIQYINMDTGKINLPQFQRFFKINKHKTNITKEL